MTEIGGTSSGSLLFAVTVSQDRKREADRVSGWFAETGGYAPLFGRGFFWDSEKPTVHFVGVGAQWRWYHHAFYVGAAAGVYGLSSSTGIGAKASVGVDAGPLFLELGGRGVVGRMSFGSASLGVGLRF